jgi:hypothetical protein
LSQKSNEDTLLTQIGEDIINDPDPSSKENLKN